MKLSETQIDFIVGTFFLDFHQRYAGALNIGRKLLENKTCIVAGTEKIFNGGIGNFISTKEAENAVDCLEYSLDIETFLKSKFFMEYLDVKVDEMIGQKAKLERQIKELSNLGSLN